MRNKIKNMLFVALLGCLTAVHLEATPSSVFWTNCTTEIQEAGTGNFSLTDYFSVFNRRHHGSCLPTDVGLLFGVFSWNDIQAEAGVDYFGGTDDPWVFNAKVGVGEDKLFSHSPAFNVGVFNVGTRHCGHGQTDQNVVDFIVGKTLPECFGKGHIYAAFYSGSRALGGDRQGFMVGMTRSFCPVKDCEGKEYDKWFFAADYASGKNAIGGGGVAMGYYFAPNVYLETGPVWYNSSEINGQWKWGVQLYCIFPVKNQ